MKHIILTFSSELDILSRKSFVKRAVSSPHWRRTVWWEHSKYSWKALHKQYPRLCWKSLFKRSNEI